MKLIKVLNEDNANEIPQIIEKDCHIFLAHSKRQAVYRGIKESKDFIKKTIRKDRRSSSLFGPIIDENFYDDINFYMKKDGFKAIRSNSILCTNSLAVASSYGEAYLVFPIGSFSFTWSTKVADYMNDVKYFYDDHDKVDEYGEPLDLAKTWWESVKNTYRKKQVYQGIMSGNELMISGKEYYAIRNRSKIYNDVINYLGINL